MKKTRNTNSIPDPGIILCKIEVTHNKIFEDDSDIIDNYEFKPKLTKVKISSTPISTPTLLSDLDWDNPADSSNPKNWKLWKKSYVTFTVGFLCVTITFGSSVYVPSVGQLIQRFGISETVGLSGLTFYLLGLGVGPIFTAPLSELYGRKPIYLWTMPTSMIFILGTAFCTQFYQILILRFFTGLFVSPAMAIAGGNISDMFDRTSVGVAMSVFALTPFSGTIMGPIVGGFVMETKSWQWVMWLQLMVCGVSLPLVAFMPETFKPAILKKRARARRIELVHDHKKSTWQEIFKEKFLLFLSFGLYKCFTKSLLFWFYLFTVHLFFLFCLAFLKHTLLFLEVSMVYLLEFLV